MATQGRWLIGCGACCYGGDGAAHVMGSFLRPLMPGQAPHRPSADVHALLKRATWALARCDEAEHLQVVGSDNKASE